MEKEISRKLAKASQVYERNVALRAIVNAIPYVGGSLDVLFAWKGQKLIQNRIKELFEELRREMSSISEEKIDKEYLESEEWFDLVTRAIEAAVRTRNREKINLYARVLRGAVTIQDRREFSPEEYLAAFTELTLKEIEVAQVIYRQQCEMWMQPKENELQWAWRMGWKKLPELCSSVPREDIPFILLRLQKSGLIREITGTYFNYTGGVYVITESFRKLMRYIGNKNEKTI